LQGCVKEKDSQRWESFIIITMRSFFGRSLTLLVIIGLIVTPPVLTGAADMRAAEAASQAGKYLQAAGKYETAARFLPWRRDLWERAATASFLAGEYRSAIQLFEKALQRHTLTANGWSLFGQSCWLLGREQKALETWKTGLGMYPSYSKFHLLLSKVYARQGNFPAEQKDLQAWISSEGQSDPSAHYRLGLLWSVYAPDRAIGELQLASSLDALYDSAFQTMRTALTLASLETDQARRLVIAGRGLGLVNEWALAEQAFRQAVAVDKANAEAWAWLGEAGQHTGQDGRAALDRALSLGRGDPTVHSLRGLYWTRQGQPQQALEEYLLAAEFDPENPLWQASIGDAYAHLGDLPPALNAYRRATELAPEIATYWRFLAVFCSQYGVQVEEVGLPAAREAVSLSPDDPQTLDALGWVFLALGRPEEARYHFTQALEIAPEFALANLHLGIAALQLNDRAAAFHHLSRARDLDANGPLGEQAQMLLNQYFP